MSLAHVILGLLQQREQTGYDLKTECFDQGIAHLWQADQAQIYRTLDKLEAQGWIACTVQIQHDRPNRKVYRITEAGEAELTHWLQTHQPLPILREPLLVQLYFAAQLPDEAIDVPALDDLRTAPEKRMHQLVLQLVIRREQIYLDWLKNAIETIHTQAP